MTFKVFNCLIGLSLIILAFTILTSASPHDIVMRDLEDLPPADPTGLACDKCIDHRANITFLYANGKCNTLDNGMKYYACGKPYRCGICMLFKGEQCKSYEYDVICD
jgi:hypothetical protein